MNSKRKQAYRTGFRAEWVAIIFMMAKGYRLLGWRYKTPVGEIDLILSRRNRLAFVEVKARTGSVEAAYAVTPKQQQRIKRAASHWLAKKSGLRECEMGFDVITVMPWSLPHYIKDAFSHTSY